MKHNYNWLALASVCLLGVFPVQAQWFATVHNFANTPDGANPTQIVWTNGLFYGTTQGGGTNGSGAIFTYNPVGAQFRVICSFTAATNNGSVPNDVLVTGNKIYGSTAYGGRSGVGTVYAVNTDGSVLTNLYSFGPAPDGYIPGPSGGVSMGGNTLYGATSSGGPGFGGTIFKINSDGSSYAQIHSFTNNPNTNGYSPQGEVVVAGNTIYGVTSAGGTRSGGTVFAMNTDGSGYTILHHFAGVPDGFSPKNGLLLNNGVLYGTTSAGGSNNTGSIFAVNTNGTGYTNLYSFSGATGNTDGTSPQAALSLNGNWLYGTTLAGGANGNGTIFRISTNGVGFTVVCAFPTNVNAASLDVLSGVVLVSNALWGTTLQGGSGGSGPSIGYNGTLFSLTLSPVITAQPQGVTVLNGNPVSFSVSASDLSTIHYQWYYSGALLSGQTGASLNFTGTTNNAGSYTVVASDNFGSVTSAPAMLTVVTRPAIVQQPQNVTATNGLPSSIAVVASGSAPLSYQWYFNSNTPVAGGTNATVSFPAVSNSLDGYYSVVITNLYGSVTSSAARLTVVSPPTPPTITQQPQNLSVTNGFGASFTNVASGAAPLAYQWYLNTNTPVAGGTNDILFIPFATTNEAGYYTVKVTNSAGSVTSSPAKLTVISTKPIIIVQPDQEVVTNNGTATFSVLAAGQNPLRYQWYSSTTSNSIGTVFTGQTNSTTSFTATTTANGRYYSVVITNTLGKATSNPALLIVTTKPYIVTNPQPVNVNLGATATFSVSAVGLAMHYQWYSNSVSTAIGTPLSGQTGSNYSFVTISNANNRYYSVVITNTFGAATSSLAQLTLNLLPYITLQPINAFITNGSSVTFTSAAAGPGPLTYQWLFQTNLPIVGATNTVLALTNANQPGAYSMAVANGSGAATSSPAMLTVAGRPIMLSANFDRNSGSYSFRYVNLAGSTNRLWASTNLAAASAWRTIATNVMAANTVWNFTDTNTAKTNKVRFYRFSTP